MRPNDLGDFVVVGSELFHRATARLHAQKRREVQRSNAVESTVGAKLRMVEGSHRQAVESSVDHLTQRRR